jgi:6-phosphogluconolactonase
MAMNFRVFRTREDVAGGAADFLLTRLERQPALIVALSGGSTPHVLYDLLGRDPLRAKLSEYQITWVIGDERCVPPEHERSNARMVKETLFRAGISDAHRFVRFRTELGDPVTIARDFEEQWNGLAIAGLDVALLGMGEDGHAASLFPGTPILDVENGVAASVFVPQVEMWRVSLTLPVLRAAKARLVLAAGDAKRAILERCRKGEVFPVTRVMEGEGESWWLVDEAAYGENLT